MRRAVQADSPAVVAFVEEILQEYGLPPDPDHTDRGLHDIEGHFHNGFLNLVFDEQGSLMASVGLVPWHGEAAAAELVKMFARKECRGQGLGHFLMRHIIAEARARGYQKLMLETATVLREARGLYHRYGFEEMPGRPAAERCNLLMCLTLS